MKKWLDAARERLPAGDMRTALANLGHNWPFPISAAFFFWLNWRKNVPYYRCAVAVTVVLFFVVSQMPSIWKSCRRERLWKKVFFVLTAAGICWAEETRFRVFWSGKWTRLTLMLEALERRLPVQVDAVFLEGVVIALCAIPFVYVCVAYFWRKLSALLRDGGLLKGVTREEKAVYAVLLLASLCFVTVVFLRTDAFYGAGKARYNIIYSSDSPMLVKENAYFYVTHGENDLRQPLFAVFAAPLLGFPYFIGRVLSSSLTSRALLVDLVQAGMLLFANFALAKALGLTPAKRIWFMILACSSYTYILFILMMEQYIVAYFWLMLCFYEISVKRDPERWTLWAAGGTLLTSLALAPFVSANSPARNWRGWLRDMFFCAAGFLVVMLAFCRADILDALVKQITRLYTFAGRKLTMGEKLLQNTAFMRNIFLAPKAGPAMGKDFMTWKMDPVATMSRGGILILLLAAVGAVWNWDKKGVRLAAAWCGLAGVFLLWLGWGTNENGLTLYSLYFGWPFFVLLFALVDRLGERSHIKYFLPAVSVAGAAGMLAVNVPAMAELVAFAVSTYPL